MCVSESSKDQPICATTYLTAVDDLSSQFVSNITGIESGGVLSALLADAHAVQKNLLNPVPVLGISGGLFFFAIVCMLLLKRDLKSFNPKSQTRMGRLRTATGTLITWALSLAMAVAFATTVAIGILNFALSNLATPKNAIAGGIPVQALQWTIVGFLVLVHWGIDRMTKVNNSPWTGVEG